MDMKLSLAYDLGLGFVAFVRVNMKYEYMHQSIKSLSVVGRMLYSRALALNLTLTVGS